MRQVAHSRFGRVGRFAGVALVAVALGVSACGGDDDTVTVEHGSVPAPVLVDLGDEGPSAGDQRIFHFEGTAGDSTVMMDWLMTTTAIDTPEAGVETRVANAVFMFDGLDDTIVIEGTGWYPGQDATFTVSATLVRAITGGTGKYEGASGTVVSTHNDDDTWTHVFKLD